ADWPKCSPRAWVSSGLLEMDITMSSQRMNSRFVVNFQPGFGCDFTDAGQGQPGKFLLPGIEHGDGIVTGDSKEQFKILAVSQRGQQRRLARRFGPSLPARGRANEDGVGEQEGAGLAGA